MSSKDPKDKSEKTAAPGAPPLDAPNASTVASSDPTPPPADSSTSSSDGATAPPVAPAPEPGELEELRAQMRALADENRRMGRALERAYQERIEAPVQTASTKSEKLPTGLRIRNPGPNPRHYWPGRGGVLLPGEVRDVPAGQVEGVKRLIASGKLRTTETIHGKTGAKVPPCVELTYAPEKLAAQIIAEEQARFDAT